MPTNASTLRYEASLQDEAGKRHFAGELTLQRQANGLYRSSFSYAPAFMADQTMPDLCPRSLPRNRKNPINVRRGLVGLPFAFEDCVPDAWGRAVLIRAHNLTPHTSDAAHLLRFVNDPIGALSFAFSGEISSSGSYYRAGQSQQAMQEKDASIEDSIRTTLQFSQAGILDAGQIQSLLRIGVRSGGARPKFTFTDDSGAWIVKPSVREDMFPIIRAEHLCLQAASQLGLTIDAPSEHIQLGQWDAIKVRRFDIHTQGGRYHIISAKSLLGSEVNTAGSYEAIANALQRLSSSPSQDCNLLFRWMLLNCAVGNVDDHLKNFAVLWSHSEGWRLSPAYDITPAAMSNLGHGAQYHSIGFSSNPSHQDIDTCDVLSFIADSEAIIRLGSLMGLSLSQIHASVDAVRDASQWISDSMLEYGISDEHAKLWGELMQRLMPAVTRPQVVLTEL